MGVRPRQALADVRRDRQLLTMNTPRAKEIFLDAIELDSARQEEFVRVSCGSDAALRGQVEGLLLAHRSNPSMLNGPADGPDTSWGSGAAAGPDDATIAAHARTEQPGDIIDRYRLVKLLGEGGFGRVFLAQQTAPLVRD